MESIGVREFRVNPREVWRKLRKNGRVIVTSTGKPIALLTDIVGKSIEEEIRIEAMARGAAAVSKLREHARKTGISRMSLNDITAEIKKSRKNR